MSNLKRDIEKVLRNLVYTIEAPSSNKGTEFTVSADVSENNVKKIINLIEKSEQKLLAKMTLDCKTVDYQGEQWNAILVKKLKNITLEQDEEIPNGAWGKNSLKKDIEEVLERFGTSCSPVATLKNMKNPLVKPEDIERATTQIINLIESVIPKTLNFKPKSNSSCSFEMDDTYANPCEYCGGTRMYDWREFTKKYGFTPNNIDGYNQCIADIKSKLIGEE